MYNLKMLVKDEEVDKTHTRQPLSILKSSRNQYNFIIKIGDFKFITLAKLKKKKHYQQESISPLLRVFILEYIMGVKTFTIKKISLDFIFKIYKLVK